MTTLPAPPVPHECDCRGLDFPLRIAALLNSDFVALSTGDEFKAALLIWAAAWEAVPAASLPDDERFLASKARLSLADFRASRDMIMHGFNRASDGRLYHEVIAGQALKAHKFRAAQSKKASDAWAARNAAAYAGAYAAASESARPGIKTEKRRGIRPGMPNDTPRHTESHAGAMPLLKGSSESHRMVRDNSPNPTPNSDSAFPLNSSLRSESNGAENHFEEFERDGDIDDAGAWAMVISVLVDQGGLSDRRARSFVGKLRKDHGLSNFELAKIAVGARASGTRSPEPYLTAAAKGAVERRGQANGRGRVVEEPGYWPVEIQRKWLVELRERPLSWRPERGPPPGLTGCKVESSLLVEFGFEPDDGARAFE
jgi:hypothetical protein